ncbi:MAG: DUF4105 domain-containing protein [Candidatus Riflebacteria bacterium]|nr:DUF4105 domain-containing protein [Candidatus Riflebacteria bacterium]
MKIRLRNLLTTSICCLLMGFSGICMAQNSQAAPFSENSSAVVTSSASHAADVNPSTRNDLWGFGVPYTLQGVLRVEDRIIMLNTSDGRLFYLVMDLRKARRFADKSVKVEGLAKQADDLLRINVKKIEEFDPGKDVVSAFPLKDHQRPPRLVSRRNGKYVMNMRWTFSSTDLPEGDTFPPCEFEDVTIDPNMVEEIYFVKKPFAPEWIAAHSLFFFKMKDGGVVNSKGEKSNGLALTIEAYQRTDQQFDLFKGIQKQFGISWILTTWKCYLEDSCLYTDYKLIKYPIILNQSQKVSLLKESLDQAAVDRSGEYYHTITNNCTNNLIVLLNRVLESGKKIRMWWIPSIVYNFRATTPVIVADMLKKKGYFGSPLPVIDKTNYLHELDQ